MESRAKSLAVGASLLAAALILSYIEAILPIAGFRIGLANIAVILASRLISRRMGLAVMLSRVIITSVLFGSATTFAFSITGGLFAWLVIDIALMMPDKLSLIGLSVLAAAAHNLGQVIAACIILGSLSPLTMLWWLFLLAVPAGLVTGFLSEIICHRIKL
ncbi:MAG: Gx transporter family protein [Ruminococcaceae bacterium]|nr:Gx transporter family protein [Oscillospiraceae bacterium]